MEKKEFIRKVLDFYDSNQRILPWRESRNPYHIWVSEIMLQQTRVETVIPYYNRFIETLPTIKDLSQATDESIYKLWEGLGYYSRVRNLRDAAKKVMTDFEGVLPQERSLLESLPGIGPYTSGAISSIAFEQKNPAVDGNVLRIFARLLEIKKSIKDKDVKNTIKEEVNSLLPNERIGDFNQGLMEIGATICLPNGMPKCRLCPLQDNCLAFKHQTMNQIPIKNKKKKLPIYKKTVLIIQYDDLIAVEQRPNTGLLKSMYQFPMLDDHYSFDQIKAFFPQEEAQVVSIDSSTHKFSHLEWNMIGYHITLRNKKQDYTFVSRQKIHQELSLPSAFKVYKRYIMNM